VTRSGVGSKISYTYRKICVWLSVRFKSIQVLPCVTPFECWRHLLSVRERYYKLLHNKECRALLVRRLKIVLWPVAWISSFMFHSFQSNNNAWTKVTVDCYLQPLPIVCCKCCIRDTGYRFSPSRVENLNSSLEIMTNDGELFSSSITTVLYPRRANNMM
jgi:hypothetical protein